MKIALSLIAALVTTQAFAESPQAIDNVARAIERASDICLSGTKYKLELNGEGKLNILRIQPGGSVSAVVGVQKSKGGVDFNDEKIREVFDEKTRNCMRDEWQKILGEYRRESNRFAPGGNGIPIVRFRFDRSWVRYWERTNLSTIRNIDGRPVYAPIEKQTAAVFIDGNNVGQVDVESPGNSLAFRIEKGRHVFNVMTTVPGGQVLQCRDQVVFDVDDSSVFESTAIINKNYASPQNAMACQLKEVPIGR